MDLAQSEVVRATSMSQPAIDPFERLRGAALDGDEFGEVHSCLCVNSDDILGLLDETPSEPTGWPPTHRRHAARSAVASRRSQYR